MEMRQQKQQDPQTPCSLECDAKLLKASWDIENATLRREKNMGDHS
jgi:hypothetical protein